MNIAFIPVRGGSKSIPHKNIKELCGKPLVYWTVKAASECNAIDLVYVSTDSQDIREAVEQFKFNKVRVVGRSEEVSNDKASTEAVMLEFATQYMFDNICLIQATSPLLRKENLHKGFELFASNDVDCVVSVAKQKRFHWNINEDGLAYPINYDYENRPRRQEFDGYYVENGAFYIISRRRLIESKNRISGNIKLCEMEEDSYFEIDEPIDWIIVEQLLKYRMINESRRRLPQIKMFLTDCDGCLTDGGMYYNENGDYMKKFNTKDGMGMELLRKKGIITGIITGENSLIVKERARKLILEEFHLGVNDKLAVVEEICRRRKISLCEVAYLGDDLNDLKVVEKVGFGCCVHDGMDAIKNVAKYITRSRGGEGAVREIADILLDSSMIGE